MVGIGILILYVYRLVFSSHPFRRCNSGPFSLSIGIMILLIQTLGLLSCPSTANIKTVALSFQALEFWPHFYKHCNAHLIAPNTGILAVFLYTLAFLSYPSNRWNFGPTFIHVFFILPVKTLRFSPYFFKHWKSYLTLSNI